MEQKYSLLFKRKKHPHKDIIVIDESGDELETYKKKKKLEKKKTNFSKFIPINQFSFMAKTSKALSCLEYIEPLKIFLIGNYTGSLEVRSFRNFKKLKLFKVLDSKFTHIISIKNTSVFIASGFSSIHLINIFAHKINHKSSEDSIVQIISPTLAIIKYFENLNKIFVGSTTGEC